MLSNAEINFLHQQEEKYEKMITEKQYQLEEELDCWKLNHYSRLTAEEWKGLENFLKNYEVDEDTELHQVVTDYVISVADRFDFMIYG